MWRYCPHVYSESFLARFLAVRMFIPKTFWTVFLLSACVFRKLFGPVFSCPHEYSENFLGGFLAVFTRFSVRTLYMISTLAHVDYAVQEVKIVTRGLCCT